jgi:hypothetical protein
MSDTFTVRVNRLLLLFLAGIGLLFVTAGFFLIPTLLGALLFWLLGGVIAAQCLWYVLFPPVLLHFSPAGVSFGTGFRYAPYTIPWTQVESVGGGINLSMTAHRELFAGAQIVFKEAPGVPAGLATSAGVSYMFHRLTIHWMYANRFPWTIVATGKKFFEQYR